MKKDKEITIIETQSKGTSDDSRIRLYFCIASGILGAIILTSSWFMINKNSKVNTYINTVSDYIVKLDSFTLEIESVVDEGSFMESLKNRERINLAIEGFNYMDNSQIPTQFKELHRSIVAFNSDYLDLSEISREKEIWLYKSIQAINNSDASKLEEIIESGKDIPTSIELKAMKAKIEIQQEEWVKKFKILIGENF